MHVSFSRPNVAFRALPLIHEALASGRLSGNGPLTARCHALLTELCGGSAPLVTHSGTAALEMAALLLDLGPGDEVIMPSWTFSSTANAVALRGAVPVFVDVAEDTLNLTAATVEAAMTGRTRAVVCVHYAGVGCQMDELTALCRSRDVDLVEDAAQAVCSTWRGQPLGTFGRFGALSFHATKNLNSGEGGALLINRRDDVAHAESAWEKGTSRLSYLRGEDEFYEWKTLGSSFLPSELVAALLLSQLTEHAQISEARLAAWRYYDGALKAAGLEEHLKLPQPPAEAGHNGHIYHLRGRGEGDGDNLRIELLKRGVETVFHYRPLHSSTAGMRYGRTHATLPVTENAGRELLRLPLDGAISRAEQDFVVARLCDSLIR